MFYTIERVVQLYHGGDMMPEMRRRKPEPTLLPTERIFNLPHHIDMVREERAFVDVVAGEMDCSTAKCYNSDPGLAPVPRITYLMV